MLRLLFLLLKAAKFGPILKSGGLMLVSVGVYALIFGWWYAVGFVLLMLVHEMGHYIAARRAGMNVGLPTFIPFLGAWIELKDQPLTVEQEARIAFAGPFAGTLAAIVVLGLALRYDNALLMALAYAGFFLNLFNLIPVVPFDGGRNVLLLLAPTIWQSLRAAWRGEVPAANPRYYEVPLEARVRYGSYYVTLLVFLCVMTYRTHNQVQALQPS